MTEQELAADDSRIAWDGTAETEVDGDWLIPWRVPAARLASSMWPNLRHQAAVPAGVRFAVRTDATELHLLLDGAPGGLAPLDVVIDGVLGVRAQVAPGPHRLHVPLPGRTVDLEVWLPHWGRLRVGSLRFAGGTVAARPWTGPRWLAYGSSITQCLFADGPSETWPALVARNRGWRSTNLGLSAEAHLDPVIARAMRHLPADLISMCLGINVYLRGTYAPRTFPGAVANFVETVREGHPDTPLVVVTPLVSPPREAAPNVHGATLRQHREQIEAAVGLLQRFGDDNLHLIDGPELLGYEDAGLLVDDLHPGAAGDRLIAGRIEARLAGALAGAGTGRLPVP